MDKKVCLDTDVCIEILKNTEIGGRLLKAIEQCEIYLSTITIFELFLRKTNLFPIEMLVQKCNILDLDELSAKKAASLFKTLKAKGVMIDLRDLFIASVVLVNGCSLATLNLKHFSKIEGLVLQATG